MSHPLLVEAIETNFVPLLIRNNVKGYEEEILKAYKEPSWNNPVIRYLDSNGKDIIPRKDNLWMRGETAARMAQALKASKKPVPRYLTLLAAEDQPKPEQATFAMHCYWEGELKLGNIPGVRVTSAGWIGRKEVVNVEFNPKQVSYEKLLKTARSLQCATTVFAHGNKQLAIAKKLASGDAVMIPPANQRRGVAYTEQKYHLRRTHLRYLPLTPIQLARVNSAVFANKDYRAYLSPKQVEWEKQIRAALQKDASVFKDLTAPDLSRDFPAYTRKLAKALK